MTAALPDTPQAKQPEGEFGPVDLSGVGPDQPPSGGWPLRAAPQPASDAGARLAEALRRLESAVDWFVGRSGFTQTKELKGLVHSEWVRKELYAAHDAARDALVAYDQERGNHG